MATIGAIVPSYMGLSPAIVVLPRQSGERAPVSASFDEETRQAAEKSKGARPDIALRPQGTRPDGAIVDGTGFRRRLGAVDPDEARRLGGRSDESEAPVERRGRPRQPTNPFPVGASAAFTAQALAQRPQSDSSDPNERAETRTDDASVGVAAYARAAAFAADQRVSYHGPGEPLRLAA